MSDKFKLNRKQIENGRMRLLQILPEWVGPRLFSSNVFVSCFRL